MEPPGKSSGRRMVIWELEVTCSASSAKFKNRIAGMLDVGKDIDSHFNHSDHASRGLDAEALV